MCVAHGRVEPGRSRLYRVLPWAGLLALAGCEGEALEGFVWRVTALATVDTCHAEGEGVPYEESFDYRLVFDGSYVELALGPDTFATGTISGCDIEYETVVWGQSVDGVSVRWQLFGEALFRQGGSACNLDGVDWEGTETFEIVSSEHPDIEPGCQYVLELEGHYVGPL